MIYVLIPTNKPIKYNDKLKTYDNVNYLIFWNNTVGMRNSEYKDYWLGFYKTIGQVRNVIVDNLINKKIAIQDEDYITFMDSDDMIEFKSTDFTEDLVKPNRLLSYKNNYVTFNTRTYPFITGYLIKFRLLKELVEDIGKLFYDRREKGEDMKLSKIIKRLNPTIDFNVNYIYDINDSESLSGIHESLMSRYFR